MMSKKGIKTDKKGTCLKKRIGIAVLAGTMALLTACSSQETVVLEEEDLVRTEDRTATAENDPEAAELDTMMQSSAGTDDRAGEIQEADMACVTDTESISYDVDAEAQPEEQVEQSTLFVHICGEVVNPGVYELPEESRIYEAVEAAGGFTEEASRSYVNLAQVLEDGCKVEIPALGEEPEVGNTGVSGITVEAEGEQNTLVDINTASKTELCSLPGIGESRAESILLYREKNGGFSKIEDIMKVEGIKEGMFEKMKDKICVRGVK